MLRKVRFALESVSRSFQRHRAPKQFLPQTTPEKPRVDYALAASRDRSLGGRVENHYLRIKTASKSRGPRGPPLLHGTSPIRSFPRTLTISAARCVSSEDIYLAAIPRFAVIDFLAPRGRPPRHLSSFAEPVMHHHQRNPLSSTVWKLVLDAKFEPSRHYYY